MPLAASSDPNRCAVNARVSAPVLAQPGCSYDNLQCPSTDRTVSFYDGNHCNATVACEMDVHSAWKLPTGYTSSPLDLNYTRCTCAAGMYGIYCSLMCPPDNKDGVFEKLCPPPLQIPPPLSPDPYPVEFPHPAEAKCNKTAGEVWDGTFDNIGAKTKYIECYFWQNLKQSGLGQQIVSGVKLHRINVSISTNVTAGKLSPTKLHTIDWNLTSRFKPGWAKTDPRFKQCALKGSSIRECCAQAVMWLVVHILISESSHINTQTTISKFRVCLLHVIWSHANFNTA